MMAIRSHTLPHGFHIHNPEIPLHANPIPSTNICRTISYSELEVSAKMFLHGRKITRYLQPVFCKQIMHTIQAPLIFNERNVVIIFFQDILSNVPCINRFNAGLLSKFNGTIDQIVSHLIWYLHHPVILFIRVVLNNFCQLSG